MYKMDEKDRDSVDELMKYMYNSGWIHTGEIHSGEIEIAGDVYMDWEHKDGMEIKIKP